MTLCLVVQVTLFVLVHELVISCAFFEIPVQIGIHVIAGE